MSLSPIPGSLYVNETAGTDTDLIWFRSVDTTAKRLSSLVGSGGGGTGTALTIYTELLSDDLEYLLDDSGNPLFIAIKFLVSG